MIPVDEADPLDIDDEEVLCRVVKGIVRLNIFGLLGVVKVLKDGKIMEEIAKQKYELLYLIRCFCESKMSPQMQKNDLIKIFFLWILTKTDVNAA